MDSPFLYNRYVTGQHFIGRKEDCAILGNLLTQSENVVVWEPFGGLCSTAVAAYRTGRRAFAAEVNPLFFKTAKERLTHEA